jgi:dihydropteroate synthase
MIWRLRDRVLDLAAGPRVMGVVNVTPDSFSDGGRFLDPDAAIAHARVLAAEGAEIIDLGAESTRPGSGTVPADQQLHRLLPVLQALASDSKGPILSVDTSNAEVATAALEAGAHLINDVTALADPAMPETIARFEAGLVLMHMRGTPATMQLDPHYDDVMDAVRDHLSERMGRGIGAGIEADQIALDPGIGFGKTLEHNLELLTRLPELAELGRPIVVGASRKSFLGRILDLPPDERLEGGLAAAAISVYLGASIIRTHDVRATARAVRVAAALRGTDLLHLTRPAPILPS